MASFILEFTFKDNAFAEIQGQRVKYWTSEGLPDFEGDLDTFAMMYPEKLEELLANKIFKAT